ncbi:MAG TPA: bifunctional protein-serine/threonine kinase/phosphatase [Desulfuromonadaceae bacterium]|nr:bifunctional protein-serine/threonine kinase/phosphatase [Desulfuromonadaceae bacterium]
MKVHTTSFGLPHSEGAESHDAFAVKAWDETVVAVLADGAGSSRAAAEAADRTVRSFVNHYETRPRTWTPQKALAEFTRLINHTLHQDSMTRFGGPELITTLSVAVIEGDRLYGLNVGDSRVYLSRGGRLEQLSCDHAGQSTGIKHALDRAIGLDANVEPHLFESDLQDGDIALLCSDGVSNSLKQEILAEQLRHHSPARTIVCAAREHTTPATADDMSAIVLDVEKTGRLRAVKESPLEIPKTLGKGEVIDGFTLVKPFQHSDRVWLATRDGQKFTIKFAPVEAMENEEILNLFIKETWNATRLQEVEFFPRAFVPENAANRFYAMEFIEAPSLKMLLRSRQLAVDEAVALGKFLLSAAQYLLKFDLVHGDLKPENILVVQGYDALHFKLVDFGSVTEIFSVRSRAGTASYLAPERFHEAPISERTEIFAIGVTLFESLTRSFPFGEIERFQTPRFFAPRRPGKLNANIPPWMESVLLRALAVEPGSRYQNFSEMLFEIGHPDRVTPFHPKDTPLLERNPLLFYKIGFYVLLAVSLVLLALLMKK